MNKLLISKFITIGVRIIALILLIFFFVPSFFVSCQGTVGVEISGFDAATGNIDMPDETIEKFDAAPWLFIIPALSFLIFLFASKFKITTMLISLANIIMMFIFKAVVVASVFERVEDSMESYVTVETTTAFKFYIILSIMIIISLIFDKFILYNQKIFPDKLNFSETIEKDNSDSNQISDT